MTYQEKSAFLNACDCLRYGYGKAYWNCCGLDKKTADLIWKKAKKYMEEL